MTKSANSGGLQTEYEFTLPRGYISSDGTLHKKGTMRLATAMDEIAPMRDPRVRADGRTRDGPARILMRSGCRDRG